MEIIIYILLYADDTILIAESAQTEQTRDIAERIILTVPVLKPLRRH